MEINKQLFENVLSGKLKGSFILKNGFWVDSNRLCKKEKDVAYKYWLKGFSHLYAIDGTPNSIFARNYTIIDFIPKTNMKENELTIEIPEGKIVDWEESKKQNKIVLKNKRLTYEDVCDKLFKNKDIFYSAVDGEIINAPYSEVKEGIYDKNNATTEHQLECILAKNMLANTAKYLNDGWKPSLGEEVYYLIHDTGTYISKAQYGECFCSSRILFKTEILAQQALEILGEETVKLALEPLGI